MVVYVLAYEAMLPAVLQWGDYSIVGIYSSKEKAEAVRGDHSEFCVEPYELDTAGPEALYGTPRRILSLTAESLQPALAELDHLAPGKELHIIPTVVLGCKRDGEEL